MALAETAQLAVNLTLGGNFTSGLSQAESSLGRFNAAAMTSGTRTGVLSSAFGVVKTAAVGVGGALEHAGSQIKNLVTGPLGMVGLAGGVLGLVGVLKSSISKVEEFGASLEKVQTLTGETALQAGTLILAFQKFGLGADRIATIVGFTEKTLGKLNTTMDSGSKSVSKLEALDKQFGLSLVDSNGKVADFSTVLEQLATFYDSNASASTKAYVASQIFGRGYTQMIPILNEGAQGLRDAAQAAQDMGLASTDTVSQLGKFHDQMHALEQQTNVLQLSIGTALLPTLIELSKAATDFVSSHRTDIVAFFKNAVQTGKQVAGVIGNVANAMLSAWNMVPPDLRDWLLKGVVADRTFKFLFGFDPVKGLLSGLMGAVTGGLGKAMGTSLAAAGLGKLFVQPVFVTNMGFGGLGNLAGGAAGAAEGAGAGLLGGISAGSLVAGLAIALAPVLAAEIVLATTDPKVSAAQNLAVRRSTAAARGINPNQVPTTYTGPQSTALPPGMSFRDYGAYTQGASSEDLQHHRQENAALEASANALEDFEHRLRGAGTGAGLAGKAFRDLDPQLRGFLGRSESDIMAEIHKQSVARFGGQGLGTSAEQGTFRRKMERWAQYIAESGEAAKDKLADLQRVEQNLRDAGIKVPHKIDELIAKAKQEVNVTLNNAVTVHVSSAGAGSTVAKSVRTHSTLAESRLV